MVEGWRWEPLGRPIGGLQETDMAGGNLPFGGRPAGKSIRDSEDQRICFRFSVGEGVQQSIFGQHQRVVRS